jgi:hypothetical protein
LAAGGIGIEKQRERSGRQGQERCADRPRGQTRLLRPRRCYSCGRRPPSGTSLGPDADIAPTWRRDTRPYTAGQRSAQPPAKARWREEPLETRDARHSEEQEPSQLERWSTVGTHAFSRAHSGRKRWTWGNFWVRAETIHAHSAGNFPHPLRICSRRCNTR